MRESGESQQELRSEDWLRQFSKQVEVTCAQFQFALSPRAGRDCVGHAITALTDADPTATVPSVDGIGAYDHVLIPCLRGL